MCHRECGHVTERHILCATVPWRVLLSGFEGPWFRARSWPPLGVVGEGRIVIGEGSRTDKNIPVEFWKRDEAVRETSCRSSNATKTTTGSDRSAMLLQRELRYAEFFGKARFSKSILTIMSQTVTYRCVLKANLYLLLLRYKISSFNVVLISFWRDIISSGPSNCSLVMSFSYHIALLPEEGSVIFYTSATSRIWIFSMLSSFKFISRWSPF